MTHGSEERRTAGTRLPTPLFRAPQGWASGGSTSKPEKENFGCWLQKPEMQGVRSRLSASLGC